MDTYKLDKTGLELAGGRLIKRDKHGAIEASFEVARIKHARVTTELDPTAVVLTAGLLALTFVFYRFTPEGMWRWIAVVVTGVAFCAGTLVVKARHIIVEVGRDTLKYQSNDLPEQVPSFVAMINQAVEDAAREEEGRAAATTAAQPAGGSTHEASEPGLRA